MPLPVCEHVQYIGCGLCHCFDMHDCPLLCVCPCLSVSACLCIHLVYIPFHVYQ